MKLKQPHELLPSLRRELKPLVWIAGDELLLLQESADAVRQFCRQVGFEEREIFTVDRSFDWNSFRHTTGNLSLFASRRLIELRLSTGKLDDMARSELLDYIESPNPDYLLLITSPRVEAVTLSTRWFKALEAAAWFLPIWPVAVDELPDWLGQRLLKAGLRASADAIQLLVQRIEGNLLAAEQEIEKLRLLINPAGKQPVSIDAGTILEAVADSSRYNTFSLIDAALSGNAVRSLRMLHGLRDEGIEPLVVLGATCLELRRLLPRVQQVEAGQPVARVADETVGRNFRRKAPVTQALRRLRSAHLYRLLDQARTVDYSVKGLHDSDPWQELENLFMLLSGYRLPLPQRAG